MLLPTMILDFLKLVDDEPTRPTFQSVRSWGCKFGLVSPDVGDLTYRLDRSAPVIRLPLPLQHSNSTTQPMLPSPTSLGDQASGVSSPSIISSRASTALHARGRARDVAVMLVFTPSRHRPSSHGSFRRPNWGLAYRAGLISDRLKRPTAFPAFRPRLPPQRPKLLQRRPIQPSFISIPAAQDQILMLGGLAKFPVSVSPQPCGQLTSDAIDFPLPEGFPGPGLGAPKFPSPLSNLDHPSLPAISYPLDCPMYPSLHSPTLFPPSPSTAQGSNLCFDVLGWSYLDVISTNRHDLEIV
ncbi:hypothetical protein BGZ61DRAFT_486945 [Ilyonectria robusta]|uniref:uncharacterized protein n=1 Tax=Ilyonectria robusta TaxID=1079257 RepID=UPI001E8D09EB|nr:uncharacterized protein BGZ61DRAFT_486945 [Ilyonectria robusta]KAH8654715.1 hypothetical protein BGZ61DRAFT_486945 [Ilyonectria robusta]